MQRVSSEAFKAGAELDRIHTDLATAISSVFKLNTDDYIEKLCDYIKKLYESRGEDRDSINYLVGCRTQSLLDYIYINFDEALREEMEKQSEGAIVLDIERDYDEYNSTRIVVKSA